MERIGIYGGTFNPVHMGHIRAAECAVKALELDKLLLIPDRIAPHKVIPEGSPDPWQRLQMLTIAAGGREKFHVSDMELKREGPSYTYETVQELRRQYPDAKLFLLMGTDMFLSFQNWRHPEKILREAALAVFCRGDENEKSAIERRKTEMEAAGETVYLVNNPVVDISSTELRRMLILGCADPYLPEGVGEYIRREGLYGLRRGFRGLDLEELERVVISLQSPDRVEHVLGCRDSAVALAKHWGEDETDAARAGLLHDVTKALEWPLQLTLCREYGTMIQDFSRWKAPTIHAFTGSLAAERIFGEAPQVVCAIRSHTTGKAGMNLLEKIIYVADYIEPTRDFPGVEELRRLAFADLNAAVKLGIETTMAHLRSRGREIEPESLEALAWLNTL